GESPAVSEADEFAPLVHRALVDLLDEVGDRPKGYLYSVGEDRVDVTPFESRRLTGRAGATAEAFPTFSEAAHRYFDARVERVSPVDAAAANQLGEWRRQREQQEKAVEELRSLATSLNRQADTLLANFPEAERQLASPAASAESDDDQTVTLEGTEIRVPRGKTVRASAQGLYEEAKRAQSKLSGAVAALADSDARLAQTATALLAVSSKATSEVAARRRTPNWFERYRWFFTSEAILVIGGRDAASNDLLVRRYLNPGDRYVHADIHGAPSVIVKHPAPGEPEWSAVTLHEAAQWAVAFSKAWRAGLASASAFAVEADQVSKSAASGEFVPRGAWVIHGTKEILKDLPTELGLGTVPDRGDTLWSVAPPRALEARGTLLYVLSPGPEKERLDRESQLARDAGLPRDRLQALLPSGGITVRRA
ncbi:MAG: NFACT RNA binding domain-containing protein, partial [Thermoplasmata archaeon]|nr:NFACT RNA binding domain-containing protein [Thermoplasmata archaeon]